MRSRATCPRHHRRRLEAHHEPYCPVPPRARCPGRSHCRRVRRDERWRARRPGSAAPAGATRRAAEARGSDRDSRTGADTAGRHRTSPRSAHVQPPSVGAGLLDRSFWPSILPPLQIVSPIAAPRADSTVALYGGLRFAQAASRPSAAVGHASCFSQALKIDLALPPPGQRLVARADPRTVVRAPSSHRPLWRLLR